VLEVPEVEEPYGPVGPHRREHILALRESDVVHLLVVRDQLRGRHAPLAVPDGARRVDAGNLY
jgi:hypothetical protein